MGIVAAYAQALVAAEQREPGFGWKFAAYMRDPKRGKGNRIQGSVAPAILSAARPDDPHVEEYVYRCLKHRADDIPVFASHFTNLGLGEVPSAALRGMARALDSMDEYQLLKYASKQFPLNRRCRSGGKASIRLVDAMGMARPYLSPRLVRLYRYLHAPTRLRDAIVAEDACGLLPLTCVRRTFFKQQGDGDWEAIRISVEQALSTRGNCRATWDAILAVPGLLPDIAFKQYVRAMSGAGFSVSELLEMVHHRRFAGLWPHQVYAGYRAVKHGVARTNRAAGEDFSCSSRDELRPVFEAIMQRVVEGFLPPEPALGLADVSGSMWGPSLGGPRDSTKVGDVAVLLSALMSGSLGYAATFSDEAFLLDRPAHCSPMDFADLLRRGPGWGSTQVAGAVVSLIGRLLEETQRPRPRTLYFFSDMQFHPPALQTVQDNHAIPRTAWRWFDAETPPLLSAIRAWEALLGPVDVVLWNLAAYDNAPLPSDMPHVLMLAGFDANSFRHVRTWQEQGSPASTPANGQASFQRNPQAELDFIRTF